MSVKRAQSGDLFTDTGGAAAAPVCGAAAMVAAEAGMPAMAVAEHGVIAVAVPERGVPVCRKSGRRALAMAAMAATGGKESPGRLIEVTTPEGALLIACEIRRSRRSRYIRLTLGSAGQARLSIPWHCSNSEAIAFLRTQGEWLQKQLAKAPARQSLSKYLDAHPAVYALGHGLSVKIGRTRRARSYYLYSLRPAEILFQLASGAEHDHEAELLEQLRAFAREVIPLRVQELAQERGIRFTRVSVRDQASRWGSCSTSGTISLNWRLVLLRPLLQDHVILHELAHLKEMNHSERFWNLLRSYDPYCDAHNTQLNVTAGKIMQLGRAH